MKPEATQFYDLCYGDVDSWVVTLGPTAETQFDPVSGEEDFTEQRAVVNYLTAWQPKQDWVPQPICIHQTEGRAKYVQADRIFHNTVGIVISENSAQKMRPMLEQEGHVLPLNVVNHDEKFFFWWVPWVRNSVDFERSEKYGNGPAIKRMFFNKDVIADRIAFRPHYDGMYNPDRQGDIHVSRDFKDEWLRQGLTGIEFVPV